MNNFNLITKPWSDYELLDSGDGKKLERFGAFILIRPETQALWRAHKPEFWKRADAEFVRHGEKGEWKKFNKKIPDSWIMTWRELSFEVRLTSFKHTGVFPEQAANWDFIAERCRALKDPKVLNLFGYTGIASLVATNGDAQVTHVDASKQSNAWAKENMTRSNIADGAIRYIVDDAAKFVEREVRRGAVYDGIILDPPAFGRGAKGEVWHIEEDLPRLLESLKKLLSPTRGSFFLLNGYAAGYSSQSFKQLVEDMFSPEPCDSGEFGELQILESGKAGRVIPSGIYVRF